VAFCDLPSLVIHPQGRKLAPRLAPRPVFSPLAHRIYLYNSHTCRFLSCPLDRIVNLDIELPRVPIVLLTRKHSRHNSTCMEPLTRVPDTQTKNKRTLFRSDRLAQEEHRLFPMRWMAERSRAETGYPISLESCTQARTALWHGLSADRPDFC